MHAEIDPSDSGARRRCRLVWDRQRYRRAHNRFIGVARRYRARDDDSRCDITRDNLSGCRGTCNDVPIS